MKKNDDVDDAKRRTVLSTIEGKSDENNFESRARAVTTTTTTTTTGRNDDFCDDFCWKKGPPSFAKAVEECPCVEVLLLL